MNNDEGIRGSEEGNNHDHDHDHDHDMIILKYVGIVSIIRYSTSYNVKYSQGTYKVLSSSSLR